MVSAQCWRSSVVTGLGTALDSIRTTRMSVAKSARGGSNPKTIAAATGAAKGAVVGASAFIVGAAVHLHSPSQRSHPLSGASPSSLRGPQSNAPCVSALSPSTQHPRFVGSGSLVQHDDAVSAAFGPHSQAEGGQAIKTASRTERMGERRTITAVGSTTLEPVTVRG